MSEDEVSFVSVWRLLIVGSHSSASRRASGTLRLELRDLGVPNWPRVKLRRTRIWR